MSRAAGMVAAELIINGSVLPPLEAEQRALLSDNSLFLFHSLSFSFPATSDCLASLCWTSLRKRQIVSPC